VDIIIIGRSIDRISYNHAALAPIVRLD